MSVAYGYMITAAKLGPLGAASGLKSEVGHILQITELTIDNASIDTSVYI